MGVGAAKSSPRPPAKVARVVAITRLFSARAGSFGRGTPGRTERRAPRGAAARAAAADPRDRSHLACFRRRVEDAASMTRTARSKHWRRARVQPDQILQADLRGRRRGYRFSGQFSGARLDCERRKGNDIHSIRANPILLRSQDRPCLPLGIPFLEIARFRLAARSNEPRISAGTFFQLAVLSPTGEPLCGSRTRESLDGVVGFQLGGRSI